MVKTNFFQAISDLNIQADWKIGISRGTDGILIVAALLVNDKVGDKAGKQIPPMILKGTPTELDEGFFSAVEAPAKVTADLFANMESYLKAQEQAKLESKMTQDKKTAERNQVTETKGKYETAMKKVSELEAAGKFGEAIMQLPKKEDYPQKATEIGEKTAELWKKRSEKENALF